MERCDHFGVSAAVAYTRASSARGVLRLVCILWVGRDGEAVGGFNESLSNPPASGRWGRRGEVWRVAAEARQALWRRLLIRLRLGRGERSGAGGR